LISREGGATIKVDSDGEYFYDSTTEKKLGVVKADLNLNEGFTLKTTGGVSKRVYAAVVPLSLGDEDKKEENIVEGDEAILAGLRTLETETDLFETAEAVYRNVLQQCNTQQPQDSMMEPTRKTIVDNFFKIFLKVGQKLSDRGKYVDAVKVFFYGLRANHCAGLFYPSGVVEGKDKNKFVFYHSYTSMFMGEGR